MIAGVALGKTAEVVQRMNLEAGEHSTLVVVGQRTAAEERKMVELATKSWAVKIQLVGAMAEV